MDTVLQWLVRKLKHKRFITIACATVCMVISLIITGLDIYPNTVYIYDSVSGGEPQMVYTKQKDLEKLIEERNLKISEYDVVDFTEFENGVATLTITRAFTVNINADGKQTAVSMTSGTVKDALEKAEVTVSDDDLINLTLTEQVNAQTEITVNRVTYQEVEKTETIPFETKTKDASWMKKGNTKVITAGQLGQKKSMFKQTFLDGILTGTELISQSVVKTPVTQVTMTGTGTLKTVSQFEPPSGFELDSKGVPVSYKKLVTGLAKAYSARVGAGTASGRPAIVGNVAVNPNVIPYGSRLYIATTDNSFVYGIAVAADTGTSLKKNQIVVDLFFSTYEECCRFGARDVNIYILN